MRSTALAVAALASILVAPALTAQQTLAPEMPSRDRLSVGLTFGLAYPQGEFSELSGVGFELSGHLLIDLDRAGWTGLRLAGTGSIHPEQAVGTPVSGLGRLSVRNRLGSLSVGPQLTVAHGVIRPYGYSTVGLIFVDTDPSFGGAGGSLSDVSGYADLTHVVTLGGGLYVRFSAGPRTIALDLGAQYRWNGDTRFVGRDGVVLTPNGVAVDPLDVSADLVVVRFGVAVWP